MKNLKMVKSEYKKLAYVIYRLKYINMYKYLYVQEL